jgi:alkaline phosphatase D
MRGAPLRLGLWLLCVLASPAGATEPLGPMATNVGERAATIWARGEGTMQVVLEGPGAARRARAEPDPAADHTVTVRFDGLVPGTLYAYRVRFADTPAREGHFRTAPAADAAAPVRIAFGGDVAGQNVCRDRERGLPIFAAIEAFSPDLFLALGDMIYADGTCGATGLYGNAQVPGDFPVAAELEDFRAHWRYLRADPGVSRLLARAAVSPIWDDHEVTNDFGPRQGGERIAPGLRAYLEYNPGPEREEPGRLYRSERWGRHAELFVLDTRSHRSANAAPDGADKSMLGAAQERWLREALRGSDATWKLVVSSVPLAIPTGSNAAVRGRDGWADLDTPTGFERSLLTLLESLRDAKVRNLVWLTTDVHFASVVRFRPFPEAPDFDLLEVATGPLQAGLFPDRALDPTLRPERLFFFGPDEPPAGFEEALAWFNFGTLEIAGDGRLKLAVRGVDGGERFALELEPR